ncbi:hypothetical protein JF544_17935 [Halobacillus kuroshimensis]|uniref:Uncharacterized protein n=1 Tax=Halobacillus kuroshimensis TaxID=302481 RepID=A0ABS3E0K4_9BACI|nr:hypothetical protein [Halobacillus kuroshimensis]MBN8237130.1 hypothetical protein [Halobacillus kuroshimensis]
MYKAFHFLFIILIFIVYHVVSFGDTPAPFGVGLKELGDQTMRVEEYNWKGDTVHQTVISWKSQEEKPEELTYLWVNEKQLRQMYAALISCILLLFYFPLSKLISLKSTIKERDPRLTPFWKGVLFILGTGIYTAVLINGIVHYQELLDEATRLLAELEPLMLQDE